MSETKQAQKKVFFPNLDGLRFFAFLSVFFAHTFYSNLSAIEEHDLYQFFRFLGKHGALGVNFFFVLSGFLITYLLIVEREIAGKISISNFYVRRILRIWPLYYAVVFVGFVAFPEVQSLLGKSVEESSNPWYYLLFFSNYSPEPPASAILGILWSIAVEEQFYLVWPLLMAFTPRKHCQVVFLSVIVISLALRTFILEDVYSNSLACMSDLAVGSWLALLSKEQSRLTTWVKRMNGSWIMVIYLIGWGLIFTKDFWTEWSVLYANQRLLFSMFFGFIIIEQNYAKNSFYKMSNWPYISQMGKCTYGLYMLHFIAIYIVFKSLTLLNLNNTLWVVLCLEPILALVLSIGIAYVSYRFFELPFLKLKSRFSKITKS